MLPFRVIQIEQYRALQQNAAKPYLPRFPLATKLPCERNLARANRQIPDRLPDRSSRRDFAIVSAQNTCCLTQKNEAVLVKWAPTSNRQWPANRCYRKQTTKPCLTGTRTHIRLARRLLGGPARRGGFSPNFTKIAHDFATFESRNTELPLWDPLWKTRRFLQADRPLLPGSAQYIECDVTYSKQTTAKFLPGATTAYRVRTNFDQFSTKVVIEKP
jgi:hypothetical protein